MEDYLRRAVPVYAGFHDLTWPKDDAGKLAAEVRIAWLLSRGFLWEAVVQMVQDGILKWGQGADFGRRPPAHVYVLSQTRLCAIAAELKLRGEG